MSESPPNIPTVRRQLPSSRRVLSRRPLALATLLHLQLPLSTLLLFPSLFLLFAVVLLPTTRAISTFPAAASSSHRWVAADPIVGAAPSRSRNDVNDDAMFQFSTLKHLLNAKLGPTEDTATNLLMDDLQQQQQRGGAHQHQQSQRPEKLATGCPRELLHINGFRHFPLVCRAQPSLAIVAYEGILDAMDECRRQMRFQRWDCSQSATVLHEPTITKHAYRESAYLWAMSAAGAAWGIATACAQGWLHECKCASSSAVPSTQFGSNSGAGIHNSLSDDDEKPMPMMAMPSANSDWDWGGCSYGVQYGVVSSRKLLTRTSAAARSSSSSGAPSRNVLHKLEKHNLKVGRKAVRLTLSSSCRCHGVSGSCQQKTCWRKPADLAAIAQHLKEKYRRARMVSVSPGGRLNARSTDLVFLEPGTDLCSQFHYDVHQKRSLPRVCSWRNATHSEGDCTDLCCGLGYSVRHEMVPYKCDCKFVWCCRLECRECLEHRWISTCNT